VVAFCENAIDFVIVGPEAPLAAGVADATARGGADPDLRPLGGGGAAGGVQGLHQGNLRCLRRADRRPGRASPMPPPPAPCAAQGAPIVVKADGLAAGKGVVVAMTLAEALAAIDDMFGGEFGAAGAEVVIEEFMAGEEASFFVLCDGKTCLPIGTAQDHKRVGDGDTGPNTGGMGAYSPAPVLTRCDQAQAMERIVRPPWPRWRGAARPIRGCSMPG
jgi:phosphoribosylamine---glycine ligase